MDAVCRSVPLPPFVADEVADGDEYDQRTNGQDEASVNPKANGSGFAKEKLRIPSALYNFASWNGPKTGEQYPSATASEPKKFQIRVPVRPLGWPDGCCVIESIKRCV